MKIVSAEEMREIDQRAIDKYGIPGLVLMENAGWRVVQVIEQILESVIGKRVTIFAGKGNNGGDAFVVARHLKNMGAQVKILITCETKEITGDAKINLDILEKMDLKVYPLLNANSLNIVKVALISTDLVIDGIFGTGFKGAVNKYTGKIFDLINQSDKPIVAIDIPSGVEANTGKVLGPCIKADHTVTMALPKIGLLLEPGASFTGNLYIGDISIPQEAIIEQGIDRYVTDLALIKSLFPRRDPEGHKGTYGHVLVVGGSAGMTGAVTLTSQAALKIGAGLVTLGVPRSLNRIMEIKLTEVMTKPLPETDKQVLSQAAKEDIISLATKANVLAIGPGMSQEASVQELLIELLKEIEIPLIIDADGLNALVDNLDVLKEMQVPVVLTPHPGEMARLTNLSATEILENKLAIAREKSMEWQVTLVLKGNKSIIATPDGKVYINPTGNSGMATAGSGDVLTGIIAGLLGQGLTAENAAVVGTFIHGLAGDKARETEGLYSLVASDIVEYLGTVTKEL